MHAIIESVEKRLEPAGRGKFVFPFNRIRICIAAASTEICARFEAVFASEPTLQDRIFQTLKAAGCNSNDLSIEVKYVDHTAGEWTRSAFKVEFERVPGLPQPSPQPNAMPHSLKLTIVHGAAEKPIYLFTTSRINLGRCPEVRDHRNRLLRTNHVAFAG